KRTNQIGQRNAAVAQRLPKYLQSVRPTGDTLRQQCQFVFVEISDATQKELRLSTGKAQVGGAEFEQIVARTRACHTQVGLGAGGNDEMRTARQPLDQLRQRLDGGLGQ